ncbi:MAG: hypothetical protein K2Q03_06125 [Sphingobacteriaceae bacterium]|nr:hypothetical protein [Sphingobacteriaceae bacterium]
MKKITLIFFVTLLMACDAKNEKITTQKPLYFSLENYFNAEAKRLNAKQIWVEKTVSVNEKTETKKVKIKDWAAELSVFSQADINKKAWKGSFVTKIQNDSTSYISNAEKIAIKKLFVVTKNNKVSEVRVYLSTKNILYHSQDTLIYFPDSLYQIKKSQSIRFLNPKKYGVLGRILSN